MLEALKEKVCAANLDLVAKGVVIYTWGNVSELDKEKGLVVIKPSGLDYSVMRPEDMVVVDLNTSEVVEGSLRPSSDLPTHLEIYRAFPEIGGITHTHSVNAVAFAQAGLSVPALGTTHADYFYGDIPCTRFLTMDEVESAYEVNTGKVIVETFRKGKLNPQQIPGVLVANHGPFAFGKDSKQSVYHAVVLEEVCKMAVMTLLLNHNAQLPQYVLDKHYYRKHGAKSYYGQKTE